jgi:hypothetical protein
MAHQHQHQHQHQAVFREIYQNDLQAVKARVQAADGGAAVLDTRNHTGQVRVWCGVVCLCPCGGCT